MNIGPPAGDGTTPGQNPMRRRLPLTADDLHLLWELGGIGELPREMRPVRRSTSAADAEDAAPAIARRGAQDRLRARGVLGPPGASAARAGEQQGYLHPAVIATLACFGGAELVVSTRVHHRDALERRGWHAVKGNALAGLVSERVGLERGCFELSSAPATRLGRELQRLVPDLDRGTGGLASPGAEQRRQATRWPPDLLLAHLRSDPAQEPVRLLAAGMTGSLQVLLHSGTRPVVAQLLWVATADGWVALRPGETDGETDGEPVIELCPVAATDLRPEITRLLAGVLA